MHIRPMEECFAEPDRRHDATRQPVGLPICINEQGVHSEVPKSHSREPPSI
jgi:hypothetical protein